MRTVVITGASTGIGRASALRLAQAGFHVFAGVRRQEDGEALRALTSGRLTPVHIDVTDGASIAAAREVVAGEVGTAGLSGLVNNAGTTVPCPVEYLPLKEFRHQLDVNLIGHLAVIQAFLPLLERARGRIVNVSSVGGKVAVPLMAPYAAGKHGLEGLSDALRLELRTTGMHVSVIEPGMIATSMGGKLERDTDVWLRSLPEAGRARYGTGLAAMAAKISRDAANGSPPDVVACAVVHALTSRRPRTRYAVGAGAKQMMFLRRVLPDRWIDRMVLHAIGVKAT
jgi:NAD(P)-dependent dehydrogenase (short-subunit alcohol dehydrogenase family)